MSKAAAFRDRIVGFRRVKASQLVANPNNWRVHSEAQRSVLHDLLSEVGIADALICRQLPKGKLEVIDGHLRREAGPDVQWPVLVLDVTKEEADKLLVSLDPLAAMATTDLGKFDALRGSITSDSLALNAMWDEQRLEALQDKPRDPVAGEDDAPEPPVTPKTRSGDLYLLGDHRLLCGDATKAKHVALVMNGGKAGLMNTDPPYGVGYANNERPNPGVAKPRVAKDELRDSDLQSFLESAFRPAKSIALTGTAAWYLWHAHLTQGFFAAAAAAAAAADVILHRQIIWVKPVLLLGRGQYHWKHEPCFMGWVEGHQSPDYGLGSDERTQTTVWEIGSVSNAERKEFNHSTPKPVGLFDIPIIKHLKQGEICYDPFAGSGPQFVSAEKNGRRCFGLELEPAYCDVIVNRWEKFSGKKAERICGKK